MLRSKQEVASHAETLLRKAKNETEKKSRCFYIGQLYFKVKEYDLVKFYVQQYLSVKPDSSAALKLMAQAAESLEQLDEALSYYEKCFASNSNQKELLLKICDLYNNDKVTFNAEKAKAALDRAKPFFPYQQVIINLQERLMNNGAYINKEEYEKVLLKEMKQRPDDSMIRIKIIKLYMETDRVDLAYQTCCHVENQQLFTNKVDWYECFDLVCLTYNKKYAANCSSEFYTYWLCVLDRLCSLVYSVSTKRALNDSYLSLVKLDNLLNECYDKDSTDEYKNMIDFYAGQLSFHIAMLLIKKAKLDSDYSSEIQKIQIWSERKTKISALLLLSVKCGLPSVKSEFSCSLSSSLFKLYEMRVHQERARYLQAYYTLDSLAKNNNQGIKLLLDSVNYFVAGKWKTELYEMFKSTPEAKATHSFFLKSPYFNNLPQKFPILHDLSNLFTSFEKTYRGELHHMIWLGLVTISNLNQPTNTKLSKYFHTTVFKSLNVTTNNLNSCGVETLNQLDIDSFLYLTVLCNALDIKAKGKEHPVTLPSCVTTYLPNEKQQQFWNDAFKLISDAKSEITEGAKFDIQKVLEQIRGNNLQLPLIVHLARTFSSRCDSDNPIPIVKDACEKRALYLWDLVLINLKNSNTKASPLDNRKFFFNYSVPNFTQSETKSISNEARLFIGSHYIKCQSYEKALNTLKLVLTPESLYKQATIYELQSVQDGDEPESRHRQNDLASKSKECLNQALDMLQNSDNTVLKTQVSEKLQVVERLLARLRGGSDDINSSQHDVSYNNSNIKQTPTRGLESLDGLRDEGLDERYGRSIRVVPTSTPRRNLQYETPREIPTTSSAGTELFELFKQMKLEQILEMMKLTLDEIKNMDKKFNLRFDKLEMDMSELKKELKQRPDLYSMLEDDEYNPEEVINYPNYFPRNAHVLQANTALSSPQPPPQQPPAAPWPQLYQPNLPYYAQSAIPYTEPQMVDYLRSLGTQRSNLNTLASAGIPLHQAPLVPAVTNLNPLHLPIVSTTQNKLVPAQPPAPNNVVITTSDTLPTTVPSSTPALFVNIPPEHQRSGPIIPQIDQTPRFTLSTSTSSSAPSGPHEFQITMPSNFKLVEKAPIPDPSEDKDIEATLDVSKDSEGGTLVEHDPLPNFKPIIPLPDEVETVTGEENETVIFDIRAKLFRFVNKEWKERGLGQLKILKANQSENEKPQFRILMRREQVHKICANHYITADMNVSKHASNDRSYFWWAHDFADEKTEVEKFLARFKTVEDGQLFKTKFDEALKEVQESNKNGGLTPVGKTNTTQVKPAILPPTLLGSTTKSPAVKDDKITLGGFTFSSQPKVIPQETQVKPVEKKEEPKPSPFASFNFGTTKSNNTAAKPAGNVSFPPKPAPKETPKEEIKCEGSGKLFELLTSKPAAGSWECSGCYTRNNADAKLCVACKTPCATPSSKVNQAASPQITAKAKDSSMPSLSSMFKPAQGSWSCDICLVQNKADVTSCVACGTVKPGCSVSAKPASTAPTFSFGIPPSNSSTSPIKPSIFGQPSSEKQIIGQPVSEKPTFGIPSEKPLFGQASTAAPVFGQTFGNKSIFGQTAIDKAADPSPKPLFGQKAEDKPVLGDNAKNSLFGSDSKTQSPGTNVFKFGDMSSAASQNSSNFSFSSAKFNFTMTTSKDDAKSPQKPGDKSDLDDSDVLDHDEDHTAGHHFQPVIEMPDLIEVKTGEEDETVLYCHRAKLFRFDKSSKEWKERGLGDFKILKHNKTDKLRLLMRRERVEKLCLNQYLTPDLNLKAQDTKSWTWCAPDFSDGTQVLEQFCLRFKTPDIAKEFKEKFDQIKSNPTAFSPVKQEQSDDDVEFVSESKIVSDELKNKAEALKLPANFYKYLDLPDCPGCLGCEKEDDNQMIKITMPQSRTPLFEKNSNVSSQTPVFGSKPLGGTPVNKSLSPSTLFGDKAPSNLSTTPSSVTSGTDASKITTFSFSPQTGTPGSTTNVFSPQNSIFGGSIFGQNATHSFSSPVFGGTPSQGEKSFIFGGQNATFGSITSNSTGVSTPSIFGGASSVTSSIFGSTTPSTPSVFGGATPATASVFGGTTPATPSVFGSNTPSTTSLFGQNTSFPGTPNLFGSQIKTPDVLSPATMDSKKVESPAFLSKETDLSFCSLAKTNANTSFGGDNSTFKWEGAGATIFGKKPDPKKEETEEKEEEKEEEEGGDEEHDPHFEPIVPLPDKIELKTGEEDEDILFSERAKLYRMDNNSKEWKERGVGLMKLLHHREHNTYRLLMRREQVHKIVCNHLITPDLKLNTLKTSETSYCWAAMNLSQDETEPKSELLCIKFKNRDIAQQFKTSFEAAQAPKQ